MAVIIRMTKMTDTMVEGVIASWLKGEGSTVKSGDILAEVETDKSTMEFENFEDGVVLYVGVKAGDAVPIDAPIAIIGRAGEDIAALKAQFNGNGAASVSVPAPQAPASVVTSAPASIAPVIDLGSIKAVAERMPLKTDTMVEGVIASWLVEVGAKVKSGDIVAEVETDKATMELEIFSDGIVLYRAVEAGQSVPVNGIYMIIGEAGANYQAILEAEKGATVAPTSAEPVKTEVASPATTTTPSTTTAVAATSPTGRLVASPLAKRLAREKGLDLNALKGSGEFGRIIKRDIDNYKPAPAAEVKTVPTAAPTASPYQESFRTERVSQMRKTIARRLSESMYTAPHFYLTMSINMDNAIAARKSINEVATTKVSFNDLVIKAVAVSLKKHPKVNASWLGDTIRYNDHVNVGVAVAVDEGLLVPVVRFTDTKSLSQIGTEVREYAKRAKDKKLQPSDWEGSTFTVSNLGMFGIEEFTAIINPPDACILAVGGINEVPVVKNGQIVVGNVMKVTLSCDHRVVDGAVGSAFLQTFKSLLEDPIRLLA